jgi:hypothetical protein
MLRIEKWLHVCIVVKFVNRESILCVRGHLSFELPNYIQNHLILHLQVHNVDTH